ncbi:MAG: carbon storage regulator [Pirellulaceae bacterium]|nr:carbon storage regulator [Pirellulaceae bacterium]
MLILSRKESQKLKLISADDSIVITIIRVSGEQVRIGVDAPMNVLVLRDELEAKSDVTV